MRSYVPEAVFSRPTHDTVKGTVALMKAPADSVARVDEPARAAWVVLPRYERGAPCELTPKSSADTLIELGQNAFNYSVHGRRGFHLLADVMQRCACFNLRYSKSRRGDRHVPGPRSSRGNRRKRRMNDPRTLLVIPCGGPRPYRA